MNESQNDVEKRNEITAMLRSEISNKTEQYSETLATLNKKQQELSAAQESISKIERRCRELEERANHANELEKVTF